MCRGERHNGIYSTNMQVAHTYTFHLDCTLIQLAGDPTEEVANTRRFRGWTTDAVWMGNVHRVAVATDRRDLRFVDVSTASLFEDIHLFGMFGWTKLFR